jgi:hypothetical protein
VERADRILDRLGAPWDKRLSMRAWVHLTSLVRDAAGSRVRVPALSTPYAIPGATFDDLRRQLDTGVVALS